MAKTSCCSGRALRVYWALVAGGPPGAPPVGLQGCLLGHLAPQGAAQAASTPVRVGRRTMPAPSSGASGLAAPRPHTTALFGRPAPWRAVGSPYMSRSPPQAQRFGASGRGRWSLRSSMTRNSSSGTRVSALVGKAVKAQLPTSPPSSKPTPNHPVQYSFAWFRRPPRWVGELAQHLHVARHEGTQ